MIEVAYQNTVNVRINSYIVGCKLEHINKTLFIVIRINSYIVGCK